MTARAGQYHDKPTGNGSAAARFQSLRLRFDLRCLNAGFTLLEILVAIFIFGVVVTTIFGSYNSVFSSAEGIMENMQAYEMAGNCLNRISVDLQSVFVAVRPAYTPPDINDPPDPYRVVGDSTTAAGQSYGRLRFTSLAHTPLEQSQRSGVAEIVYYVQENKAGRPVLYRADNLYPYPSLEETGRDPILCENVRTLVFTYYDADGTAYESWDSDAREYDYQTPRSIGIRLEVDGQTTADTFETRLTLPIYREKTG